MSLDTTMGGAPVMSADTDTYEWTGPGGQCASVTRGSLEVWSTPGEQRRQSVVLPTDLADRAKLAAVVMGEPVIVVAANAETDARVDAARVIAGDAAEVIPVADLPQVASQCDGPHTYNRQWAAIGPTGAPIVSVPQTATPKHSREHAYAALAIARHAEKRTGTVEQWEAWLRRTGTTADVAYLADALHAAGVDPPEARRNGEEHP
jgi:hypothetical protein